MRELLALEDTVGDFMQYWGFKKIHGRIWLHLYTSDKPLDSAELMKRLKVSKGLMSLAMRELIEYKVIQAAATGPHGTVFYEANSDIQGVITNVLKSRETAMLEKTMRLTKKLQGVGADSLKKSGISAERVDSVAAMTESAQTLLGVFLALGPIQQEGDLFQGLLDQYEK